MSNTSYQRLSRLYASNKLPWIIICIGVALRIIRYLHNPSLWFDESDTSIDIINRTFSQLIEPSPDWSSKYPYGFLLLIKVATQLFGNSEYSLRLFPLSFGIGSVFLFYRVVKNHLAPRAALIALGLFAVLDPLVLESCDTKPYSGDVAFALIIIMLGDYIRSRRMNMANVALTGMVGAVIIWFSHPSAFVMAGIGICLTIYSLRKKDWSETGSLATVFLMWALSFFACYFIYTKNLILNFDMSMEDFLMMERSFVPFPPKSLNDIRWIMDIFFEMFSNTSGLTFAGISAFAFITGAISIYKDNKDKFYLLMSPILVTLLASILRRYPFNSSRILFLVPFILFFISEGVEYVRDKLSTRSVVPAVVFIAVLFFHPLSWAVYHAKTPASPEEIRPAISYVKNNWQEGDKIYVHYYAQYAFEYYTKHHPDKYAFDEDAVIIGIAPRGWYRHWRKQDVIKYYDVDVPIRQSSSEIFKTYIKDLNKVIGHKRVWVLFTSVIIKDGMQEEKFYVFHLDNIGKRLDQHGRERIATAYLYDLSERHQ